MGLKMKELPEGERPCEKCRKYGAEALSDAELLAVFLRTGGKDMNVLELAHCLLKKAGGSLSGLYRMSVSDFMEIPGIGGVKAAELRCLSELTVRMSKSRRTETLSFHSPKSVAAYYMEEFRHREEESLTVLYLDTKLKLIREWVASKGSVNASMVPVREIISRGLRENAVYMILMHNHPSGDPEPSDDDVKSTLQVEKAGVLCGIRLTDHLVFGDGRFVSMKERGLLNGHL